MTFKEQIKHPKWQKKRLEILERDGFKCNYCEDKSTTLHVHHFRYTKGCKIWEYDNDDLITYCEDCHKEWHDYNDTIKEWASLHLESICDIYRVLERLPIGDPIGMINIINYLDELNHED